MFSSSEDISKPKTIAYFYDGEKHDAPPAKDSGYEIDVVNCDKATGVWSNENWNLTLKDIEGTTTCVLNFKKKLLYHSLKINPNGGKYNGTTGITSVDLKETKTYQLSSPTRKGYNFDGWDIDNDSSRISGSIFVMGNKSTTIIAKWTPKQYQIEIKNSFTCDKTESAEYNSRYELCNPVRDGYTFAGWEKTAGTLDGNTLIVPASNVVVTAKWTENDYDYIVIHKQESLTGAYTIADTGTFSAAFGTEVSPDTKEYEGFTAPEKQTVTIGTDDNTIEYLYSRNTYNLTINPDGGITSTNLEQQLKYGQSIQIESPIKTGYNFTGWTLTGADSTFNSSTKQFTMGTENATLTARWTVNQYNLTVQDTNVCDGVYSIDYQGTYTLCTPYKEGHTFAGWDDSDLIVQNNVATMKAKNSIVKAKWTVNNYNYIVYHNKMNLDGTTYTRVDADTYNSSSDYGTVIVTQAKAYTGFATLANKTITIGVENNNPPSTNVVNYNYERNKYYLTINPNNGTYSGQTSLQLYYDQQTTLSSPTRIGYNFNGWTKSGNSTLSDNVLTMGSENTTLTANWQARNYVVTFNPNQGSVTTQTKTVTYDQPYGDLPTPVRSEYVFLGWYTDPTSGTKVESSTTVKITSNQTLYAHWELEKYSVTLNTGAGVTFTTSTGNSTSQSETGTITVSGNFGTSTVSASGISTLSLSGNSKSGTTGLIKPGTIVTVYTPFSLNYTNGYTFTSSTTRTYNTYTSKVSFSGYTGGTQSGFYYTFTMQGAM